MQTADASVPWHELMLEVWQSTIPINMYEAVAYSAKILRLPPEAVLAYRSAGGGPSPLMQLWQSLWGMCVGQAVVLHGTCLQLDPAAAASSTMWALISDLPGGGGASGVPGLPSLTDLVSSSGPGAAKVKKKGPSKAVQKRSVLESRYNLGSKGRSKQGGAAGRNALTAAAGAESADVSLPAPPLVHGGASWSSEADPAWAATLMYCIGRSRICESLCDVTMSVSRECLGTVASCQRAITTVSRHLLRALVIISAQLRLNLVSPQDKSKQAEADAKAKEAKDGGESGGAAGANADGGAAASESQGGPDAAEASSSERQQQLPRTSKDGASGSQQAGPLEGGAEGTEGGGAAAPPQPDDAGATSSSAAAEPGAAAQAGTQEGTEAAAEAGAEAAASSEPQYLPDQSASALEVLRGPAVKYFLAERQAAALNDAAALDGRPPDPYNLHSLDVQALPHPNFDITALRELHRGGSAPAGDGPGSLAQPISAADLDTRMHQLQGVIAATAPLWQGVLAGEALGRQLRPLALALLMSRSVAVMANAAPGLDPNATPSARDQAALACCISNMLMAFSLCE